MSLHPPVTPAISESPSQSLCAECAYPAPGVACVILAVVTIPVDRPRNEAKNKNPVYTGRNKRKIRCMQVEREYVIQPLLCMFYKWFFFVV